MTARNLGSVSGTATVPVTTPLPSSSTIRWFTESKTTMRPSGATASDCGPSARPSVGLISPTWPGPLPQGSTTRGEVLATDLDAVPCPRLSCILGEDGSGCAALTSGARPGMSSAQAVATPSATADNEETMRASRLRLCRQTECRRRAGPSPGGRSRLPEKRASRNI